MLSPIQKIIYYFSIHVVFIALGLIIAVGFMLLYPVKVIEFKDLEVLNTEVKAGEVLEIKMNICKYHPYPATLTPVYIDGVIYSAPSYQSNIDVGCTEFVSHSNIVPHSLPAGEYYMKFTATYQVNRLRQISESFETNKFIVVP